MDIIRNFFWFSSGANQQLLRRCPTESNKYIGIGCTVLFTGIFASLSGGYALYTVFNSTLWACLFGFLWGSMIYNLDRYIVCSMKKSNSTWQEWKIALPRILLALLLAFVIATPLELKIFEKEINVELKNIKAQKISDIKNANNNSFPEIREKLNKIEELKKEINQQETNVNIKSQDYYNERNGIKTPTTSGIPSRGREADRKDQLWKQAQQELNNKKELNDSKIEQLNSEIKQLEKERDGIPIPEENQFDGLNTRIQALHNIGGIETIFITLLFIAIELAPIIVKLLSPRGPYDDLLENHEHSIQVFKEEQIAKRNHKTNERLQIIVDSSNNAIREENEANKNILQKIVQAETELAQEMITQWKAEEMGKIKSGKYKQKEES